MAPNTHSKAALKDHFSLNQIIAGISKTRSYAYDRGAQNKEAAIACDNKGILGKDRNLITTNAAMATKTIMNGKLAVPE